MLNKLTVKLSSHLVGRMLPENTSLMRLTLAHVLRTALLVTEKYTYAVATTTFCSYYVRQR